MSIFKGHHKVSSQSVFRWLMLLSLVFVVLPRGLTDRLDDVAMMVVSPFSKGSRDASLAVSRTLREGSGGTVSEGSYKVLEQRYRLSQARLINVSEELRHQREVNVELSGLRQRFGMRRVGFVSAQVVGSDTSSRSQYTTLNQGSLDYVSEGQLVLASSARVPGEGNDPDTYQMCVVGRIARVGMWTSQLQLVSDAEFTLPVWVSGHPNRDSSWQAAGILSGRSMKPMAVSMIKREYPVQVGDSVLTRVSPVGLPVEMVVGTVQGCRPDDDDPVMWEITVLPSADLGRLRQVVVVDVLNRSRLEP